MLRFVVLLGLLLAATAPADAQLLGRRTRSSCPGGVCPTQPAQGPVVYSQGSFQQVATYTPRWQNNDGLTRMEHARVYHGIDTTGLSQSEVYRMMDQDHDMYGPGHSTARAVRQSQPAVTYTQPAPVYTTTTVVSRPVITAQQATPPAMTYTKAYTQPAWGNPYEPAPPAACPGGVCPTTTVANCPNCPQTTVAYPVW